MKNIGARMRNLRENMNLTPQAVPPYLDISTEDLLEMEEGRRNIALSILNRLCSLFGCSEKYLLCRSDESEYTPFQTSDEIETADLEGIAGFNRIYMNMKYLNSKVN